MVDVFTTEDSAIGILTVQLDEKDSPSVTITGPQVSTVVIQRKEGSPADSGAPIGSRKATNLLMTVGDAIATLSPGSGFLSRRAHRVDVEFKEHTYRLIPTGNQTSTFFIDGKQAGTLRSEKRTNSLYSEGKRVGALRTKGSGTIRAVWNADADPSADAAAIAYALAAAFGTGGPPFLKSAIGAGMTPC